MQSQEEKLTTQQSLDLITSMIHSAQGKVKQNSIYFLLWGITVVIANLGMFTLIQLNYEHPYYAWIITIPAWVYTLYLVNRQRQHQRVSSHLDRVTGWLWMSFGVAIFTLVAFGKMINFQLNPVILIVTAVPTLVSGVIIKFRPLIIGGISFWVFGILCFVVGYPWEFILGAIAVTIGYLIPGFMLRNKKEN